MKLKFLMIITALILSSLIANNSLEAYSNTELKNVLYLNSYHKGFLWSDEITRGIEDVLKEEVNLHIEYMDSKRQYHEEYKNIFKELLAEKHKKHNYDLVITSDDNAFDFILDYKLEIFGDIPHVFSGTNYLDASRVEGLSNITGVNEKADIRSNIELIETLHPTLKEIVLIVDDTTTGKNIQTEIIDVIESFSNTNIDFQLLTDISFEDLLLEISKYKKGTIILLNPFLVDKQNKHIEYDYSTRNITQYANVPVYSTWKYALNHGITGGYLVEGYSQGKFSAEIALDILNGEAINEIPIIYDIKAKLYFDYNELKKHNIDINQLPSTSTIINRPENFYTENKSLILFVSLIVIILCLLLIIVIISLLRSKRDKFNLHKSQEKLELALEGASLATWDWNVITNKTFYNDRWGEMIGLNNFDSTSSYDSWIDLIHPDDLIKVTKRLSNHLNGKTEYYESEHRLKQESGNYIWVFDKGKITDYDENKKAIRVSGTNLDITKRKEQEKELLKRNEVILLHKENLEIEVNKRTTELEESLSDLKLMQSHLLESQKMSSLSSLVAGVAHEMNTPIGSIMTLATHLQIKTEDILKTFNDNQISKSLLQKYLTTTSESMDILIVSVNKTIQLIESFKKVAVNRSKEECRDFIIRDYIKYSINDSKSFFKNNNFSYTLDCDDNLHINNKPGALYQVISNLIENSFYHGFHNLPKGEIKIAVSKEKNKIVLLYSDNGHGIPSSDIKNIFEPFFTTKRGAGFTGLGLHIVYNLVTQVLEGSIQCSINDDLSTEFEITFPDIRN